MTQEDISRILIVRGYKKTDLKKFQADNKLVVDGVAGPVTRKALMFVPNTPRLSLPSLIKAYGQPIANPTAGKLKTVYSPFPLKVSWDEKTKITKFPANAKLANRIQVVFNQIHEVYGDEAIEQLRINVFGGCYNYRKARLGTNWSRHAFAAAVDLDDDNNQLTWTDERATFAKPAYRAMILIFHKQGFLNLGIFANRDWMHFEAYK